MEGFLKEVVQGEQFELFIDKNIFSQDIILKSAYQFLERGYFFFKLDVDENIILQFTKKTDNNEDVKNIIGDFSDELLSVYLRDKLEIENKDIREKIVGAAIANSLDSSHHVALDTDNSQKNEIDFDKDIDEILKEIENDPELKIDEEEIEKILKEIEEETESEIEKPMITIDPEAVKKAKKNFKK